MDTRHWVNTIISGARDEGVVAIVAAINAATAARQANAGSVVVACSQVLGQIIARAGPEIAPEIRAAIMGLIDDHAMRAVLE